MPVQIEHVRDLLSLVLLTSLHDAESIKLEVSRFAQFGHRVIKWGIGVSPGRLIFVFFVFPVLLVAFLTFVAFVVFAADK
jgi:hypothetical protein